MQGLVVILLSGIDVQFWVGLVNRETAGKSSFI